jgi:tetratricopeptide (TPR) repeat protein
MDDLRYLLRAARGVGRVIRRRVQQAWRAREIQKFVPLFMGGFLFAFFSRWLLPQPVREFLSYILIVLLVAIVGFYAVRFTAKVRCVYCEVRRSIRFRKGEQFVLAYEAVFEPQSEMLYQQAASALEAAESFLQTPAEGVSRYLVVVATERFFEAHNRPRGYAGWAHHDTETVSVVHNGDKSRYYQTLLHEWAHIITACWNEDAPVLFLEGIAEATEYHAEPLTAHANALYFLHYLPSYSLLRLLDETHFRYREWERAHYAWAGSFTLYLIEQFGLARFREFYTQCRQGEEDRAFQQVFGMSMGQAELLWREYLHTQLPESARAETLQEVLEHRIRWAIADSEGIVVVQALSEQMVQMRPDFWLGYYGRAHCAFWVADLHGALHAFEQANAAPVQSDDALRGRAWFECGLLCDLLQRRERAIKCYQTALQYPDHEDARAAYHARATRYLATPYDYTERYRFLTEVQQAN